jgi:hypothetical protein
LGCCTVTIDKFLQFIPRILVPSSAGSKEGCLDFLTLRNVNPVFRNFGNFQSTRCNIHKVLNLYQHCCKKGRGHPLTCHGSHRWVSRSIALTAVNLGARCGWVGGKRSAPASLLPRKEPVPLVGKAVWTLVPVRTIAENLPNTNVRTPKHLTQPVASRYTEYTTLTA